MPGLTDWLFWGSFSRWKCKPNESNTLCFFCDGHYEASVNRCVLYIVKGNWRSCCVVCWSGMEFSPCTVDVFRVSERMDYPRDANGNIIAMVHPDLQVPLFHADVPIQGHLYVVRQKCVCVTVTCDLWPFLPTCWVSRNVGLVLNTPDEKSQVKMNDHSLKGTFGNSKSHCFARLAGFRVSSTKALC